VENLAREVIDVGRAVPALPTTSCLGDFVVSFSVVSKRSR